MARYIKDCDCAKVISEKFNIPLGDVIDVVYDIPTADVEEVKHGKWIEDIKEITPFNGIVPIKALVGYKCSLCGRAEVCKEPCCNCGAKMDERS